MVKENTIIFQYLKEMTRMFSGGPEGRLFCRAARFAASRALVPPRVRLPRTDGAYIKDKLRPGSAIEPPQRAPFAKWLPDRGIAPAVPRSQQ